jgi:hypothetical protein
MEDFEQHFGRYLFVGRDLNVFAVLDGASIPKLLDTLHQFQPEYACLYRGELKPDMAHVAPYLVRLEPESEFTDWVIENGRGKHWGVFLRTASDLAAMRRHLRTLLVVHDADGKPMSFRYYDPRVLRVFLPTCNSDQLATFFGPVDSFLVDDESSDTLIRFRMMDDALKIEKRKFTTEEQESLELAKAEKELLRHQLEPSEEDEVEMTEDELQQSLVDFWSTMMNYKLPKKPRDK